MHETNCWHLVLIRQVQTTLVLSSFHYISDNWDCIDGRREKILQSVENCGSGTLTRQSGFTSQHVSCALDVSVPNAGMTLYRLHRQGLVDRKTDYLGIWRKPPFRYSVNERGTARLEYYRTKALSP
ncbi:MAG: hypothetical protein OEW95_12200 [Candidatus Bathyarchaeota archaeon]|nr:hypothetical protein [Candidatus Bathyarchaeota archaeon]